MQPEQNSCKGTKVPARACTNSMYDAAAAARPVQHLPTNQSLHAFRAAPSACMLHLLAQGTR